MENVLEASGKMCTAAQMGRIVGISIAKSQGCDVLECSVPWGCGAVVGLNCSHLLFILGLLAVVYAINTCRKLPSMYGLIMQDATNAWLCLVANLRFKIKQGVSSMTSLNIVMRYLRGREIG
ncbi:unnamed protein product [Thelazia callipaeda]|uniref:SWIM-type domain-containing protein n=1 Tax=Thelazia callipaeda TaxID=103827 RepID=A0A0N5D3G2_THECL|nr:unnamed protein product [Thelazia callipaeda]